MEVADNNIKILLVDDDKGLLTIVKTVVSKAGDYSILTDINGEDAWNTILEEKPDVVVSDYMMPILDGQGLLERIRDSDEIDIKDLYFIGKISSVPNRSTNRSSITSYPRAR